EGVVALDLRRDLIAEEVCNRLDQFGGCRFVLHYFPLGANSLSKSISVSDERRPIMARSIEWSGPLRKRCIMPQHMMPQRSVPITSQNITRSGSALRPVSS